MCCATHRSDPDTPRRDGLCKYAPSGVIYRESCTDPTWKSPNCIKLCVHGTGTFLSFQSMVDIADDALPDTNGKPRADGDTLVTLCSDQSYCCGLNNTACCEKGDGVWIRDGSPTNINPNSTDAGSSETNNSTQATTGAATNTTDSSPGLVSPQSTTRESGLSGGAIAGIVIGAILLILIFGLAYLLTARRKRQGATTDCKSYTEAPSDEKTFAMEKDGDGRVELHDTALMPELEPANPRVELASTVPRRELE